MQYNKQVIAFAFEWFTLFTWCQGRAKHPKAYFSLKGTGEIHFTIRKQKQKQKRCLCQMVMDSVLT